MIHSGKVIKGIGRARHLGYPTANLDSVINIEDGIYKCTVFIDQSRLLGALMVSEFEGEKKYEIHILDFDTDMYGQILRFEIHEKIRDWEKFNSDELLIAQILKDLEYIKNT